MPSLSDVPFLSGYLGQQAVNRQAGDDVLKQATGYMTLQGQAQEQQAKMAAAQKVQAFQREIEALGPEATPEQRMGVASRYTSPKDLFDQSNATIMRRETNAQTKQMALARLQQAATTAEQTYQFRVQSATTQAAKDAASLALREEQQRIAREALALHAAETNYNTGSNFNFGMQPPAASPAPAPQPAGPLPPGLVSNPVIDGQPITNPADRIAANAVLDASDRGQPMTVNVPAPVAIPGQGTPGVRGVPNPAAPPVAAAPVATTAPAVPGQPAAPVMPVFTGSPRARAEAENRWRLANSKLDINMAGGRESQQNNRVITGANEAVAVLKNIAELPITASTGIFGTRGQQTGLFHAGMETLTQKATTQEVQDYQSITSGLQRFLGAIETSGMTVPISVMRSADSVVAREGMSNLTKLRNMAEIRQIIEKGSEVLLANPRVPAEQKALLQKAVDEAKAAVPFTQSDITKLQQMQRIDPRITLADLVKQLNTAPAISPEDRALIDKYKPKPR